MIGMGTPSIHNKIPRPMFLSPTCTSVRPSELEARTVPDSVNAPTVRL
jgi:hypothetical protein